MTWGEDANANLLVVSVRNARSSVYLASPGWWTKLGHGCWQTEVNLGDCLCVSPRVSGSRSNVFMRFKTTAKDGLLMWRGDSLMSNSDFISLGLRDGALMFR